MTIGVVLILVIWASVDVILGVSWLVTKTTEGSVVTMFLRSAWRLFDQTTNGMGSPIWSDLKGLDARPQPAPVLDGLPGPARAEGSGVSALPAGVVKARQADNTRPPVMEGAHRAAPFTPPPVGGGNLFLPAAHPAHCDDGIAGK
jgi:hypothetical protein